MFLLLLAQRSLSPPLEQHQHPTFTVRNNCSERALIASDMMNITTLKRAEGTNLFPPLKKHCHNPNARADWWEHLRSTVSVPCHGFCYINTEVASNKKQNPMGYKKQSYLRTISFPDINSYWGFVRSLYGIASYVLAPLRFMLKEFKDRGQIPIVTFLDPRKHRQRERPGLKVKNVACTCGSEDVLRSCVLRAHLADLPLQCSASHEPCWVLTSFKVCFLLCLSLIKADWEGWI